MAVNRYQHRHVQPYRAAGGFGVPDIEFGANMAGHVADYAMGRGDFAPLPPAKRLAVENNQLMEADTTYNENDNGNADVNVGAMRVGAAGSNGFLGKLTGNTQDNNSYEAYYHERLYGHAKKLRNCFQLWGMSKWSRKDWDNNNRFPLNKYGTNQGSIDGLVYVKASDVWGTEVNPFQPYGLGQTCPDLSESVYSNAINFYLKDFFDNKLLSDDGTTGLFTRWNKFRLKSFTVHITPVSHHESMVHQGRWVLHSALNHNGLGAAAERATFRRQLGHNGDLYAKKQHYWFFRDEFGSYVNNDGNIPATPPDSTPAATEAKLKREQYAIKNMDRNLCKVSDGEPFSFTREIRPMGSYYFTKETIIANKDKNISTIVAALEGQVTDASTGTIIKKMPEFFNILYCPDHCNMDWVGEIQVTSTESDTGYLLLPKLCTTLLIKTTAKWEGFDYNYSAENQQSRMADPLESAILDYNMEKTIQSAQLNRGL